MAINPHIKDINRYVRGVLSGKIPACQHVMDAANRHKSNLARQKNADYPYYFDQSACVNFVEFCEIQVHVKGKWVDQPIKLEPWQKFTFGIPFGWKRKSDGKRRFREIFVEVCRKNGKSQMGAMIGLYMLIADKEGAPEVYSGATTERQAHETFDPAWKMINKNSKLKAWYNINLTGTEKNPTGIFCMKNGGKFIPVIGNPGDGPSPSCSITDEYHEHATSSQLDSMKTGMGAREQPLRLIITTAGENISYPCFEMLSDAIKINQGVLINEEVWAVIYTIDSKAEGDKTGDDWKDFSCWYKANPNLGVSVYEDFLRARHHEAMTKAEKQSITLCKHLNIWSSGGQTWINQAKWADCADKTLAIDDFEGEECALALDLASKIDIAAYARVFFRNGVYYPFLKYYLPEDTVNLIENQHYQKWVLDGLITATPGARTDFDYILDDVKADAARYSIRGLGYDPYESGMLINQIIKEAPAIQCIEVNQSPVHISAPMKDFESLVYDKKICFDGDPVLTWMVSNVVQKQARNKKYFPTRQSPKNKIDGLMTILFGLIVWAKEVPKTESVYETRGIRHL